MKLMIASDLHGSAYYTGLLMERLTAEAPDRFILLGDLLYHGPRNDLPRDYDTRRTAALLNAARPIPLCVRGNCDAEVDQMVLDFPILQEEEFLTVDGRSVFLTHGHHLDRAAAGAGEGALVLYGHTHVPAFRIENGAAFVNPGSVSLPKENSAHSYLTLENGLLRWKDAETGETLRELRL